MHGRFKTGTGGLGHCIIRERNVTAAQRFYAQLGMRGGVEYKIGSGKRSIGLVFMHCNDRDHTVAFGIPGADRRLNHVMIEVDNLDDVGMTYDIVRKNNVPVLITPGSIQTITCTHFISAILRDGISSMAGARVRRPISPNIFRATSTAIRCNPTPSAR